MQQIECELVLSRACVAWRGRIRQSKLACERAWLLDPHAPTGNWELPSHWLPASPSQVLVPVQAVGIRPSGVSYQRSNRGRNIGIPWPIVPQLYLLNERA